MVVNADRTAGFDASVAPLALLTFAVGLLLIPLHFEEQINSDAGGLARDTSVAHCGVVDREAIASCHRPACAAWDRCGIAYRSAEGSVELAHLRRTGNTSRDCGWRTTRAAKSGDSVLYRNRCRAYRDHVPVPSASTWRSRSMSLCADFRWAHLRHWPSRSRWCSAQSSTNAISACMNWQP